MNLETWEANQKRLKRLNQIGKLPLEELTVAELRILKRRYQGVAKRRRATIEILRWELGDADKRVRDIEARIDSMAGDKP